MVPISADSGRNPSDDGTFKIIESLSLSFLILGSLD